MKRLIPFEKYQANGNDFIILDFFNFELIDLSDFHFIHTMCDRRFGIGADGLIALCKSQDYDFNMVYYNADGNLSSFCGNGSRAAVKYMSNKQGKSNFSFEAFDGPHLGIVDGEQVKVKMKDIDTNEETAFGTLINSGSPHLVLEVSDPFNMDVNSKGRELRTKFGKEGVNVNFIKQIGDHIQVATYERGVEAETLACGTGIVASSYYANIKNGTNGFSLLKLKAKGGELNVEMQINGVSATNIWLSGPANKVFSGFYHL